MLESLPITIKNEVLKLALENDVIQLSIEKSDLDITNAILNGINAGFSVAIAGILAWIAWKQFGIDEKRSKHEMFDKRYPLVKAIEGYVKDMITGIDGQQMLEQRWDFESKVAAARLIFDDDIRNYFDDLIEKGTALINFANDSQRATNARERGELVKKMYEINNKVDSTFKDYFN